MKNFLVSWLLCSSLITGNCESFPSLNKLVPLAISKIIQEFFVANSEAFDFVIYGSDTRISSELIGDVVMATREIQPYNVIKVPEGEIGCKLKQSAILIFETFEDFIDFHARVVLSNEFPKQFHFLVYICDHGRTQQISSISSTPPTIFHFESFLTHAIDEKVLRLLSYETFQQPHCREWEEVEINRFSEETEVWENKSFFMEKFRNFNGCELTVGIVYPQGLATGIDFKDDRREKEILGYASKFNEVIGHHLNYSINYNPLNAITHQHHNRSQLNDFSLYVQKLRMQTKQIHMTMPFTVTDDVVLISRAKPYTFLEKVVVLLDVLIGMLMVTAVAVVTMCTSKLATRKLNKLNETAEMKPLMIRALISAICRNQTPTIGRRLTRFLLTTYTLLILASRPELTEKILKWKSEGIVRSDVTTIDEMIENNFTFYLNNKMELYKEMEIIKRADVQEIPHQANDNHYILEYLLKDGSNRGVVMNSEKLLNLIEESEGIFEQKQLNEKLITDHIVYWFTRNNFMFDSFNTKVSQLVESGLAKKLINDFSAKKKYKSKRQARKFAFNDLMAGYQIALLFLSAFTLSYIGEFFINFW